MSTAPHPAAARERAVAALERRFDGSIPPDLRETACRGAAAAARCRIGREARLFETLAGETRRALAAWRRRPAAGALPGGSRLAGLAGDLARWRRAAVARLAPLP